MGEEKPHRPARASSQARLLAGKAKCSISVPAGKTMPPSALNNGFSTKPSVCSGRRKMRSVSNIEFNYSRPNCLCLLSLIVIVLSVINSHANATKNQETLKNHEFVFSLQIDCQTKPCLSFPLFLTMLQYFNTSIHLHLFCMLPTLQ